MLDKVSCWCLQCRPITLTDMRMVVCPVCGNKRCPRANDHKHACTGSNEPGQSGSSWSHVAPLAHSLKMADPVLDAARAAGLNVKARRVATYRGNEVRFSTVYWLFDAAGNFVREWSPVSLLADAMGLAARVPGLGLDGIMKAARELYQDLEGADAQRFICNSIVTAAAGRALSSSGVDTGPWAVGETTEGKVFLQSDDFEHDVRLYVDGDFANGQDKVAYARNLVQQLNASLPQYIVDGRVQKALRDADAQSPGWQRRVKQAVVLVSASSTALMPLT